MSDTDLIGAARAGDAGAVKELIDLGVEINLKDNNGWTPLNYAAGKGYLEIVRLLVKHGADVFGVGRDQRTPAMIALAAGHREVVEFLRQAEDQVEGEKPVRPQRQYCKAYYLTDLRKFPDWAETRAKLVVTGDNGASSNGNNEADLLSGDDLVYLHQDYTVTKSMWHGEDAVFQNVTPAWERFCTKKLKFKVPDDLDLIGAAKTLA